MKLVIDRSGRTETLYVESASQMDILPGSFRNFRGEKRKDKKGKVVNDEGKRNFNLALDLPTEALDDLASTGINIKELAPKDEEYGDQPLRFVKVNVAMDGKYPPNLYLVSGKNMKELTENELALLDASRFSNVDLVIRTYHRDESTTTLYLQKGYFTIEQDPISAKYSNLEMSDFDVKAPGSDDCADELPFD